MNLFTRQPPRLDAGNMAKMAADIRDYLEYLRQQGKYAADRTEQAIKEMMNNGQ